MAATKVRVEGLDAMRRDMIRLDRDTMPKAFIEAGQAVAVPVAAAVAAALPRRTGRLVGSVRTAKIRTGASIRVGSKAVPYAGPVEFGAWPRGRPFLRDGRYIFPAARATMPPALVVARYETALNAAIARNGWSTP